MIRALVSRAVMFMNAHVDNQGVSTVLSPREIVLRWQLGWRKHCKGTYGALCQAFDDPTITNTLTERTTDAICLGPTGNRQGTYKFLNLETGRAIKRRQFTEIPIPDSYIKKVNAMGRRDQRNGRLVFRDRNNNPYEWEEEHTTFIATP